jgi:hypothetical protein
MSHWYDEKGRPQHTYKTKKGDIKPTTLRQARANGWFPSVTTVLSTIAKPGLESWKIRTALGDAFDNRPFANEDVRTYIGRIMDKATQRGEAIMDFGTNIHNAIELALKGGGWEGSVMHPEGYEYELAEFVNPVAELFADNKWKPVGLETVLVGDGYAGTADCIYMGKDEYGIIDFKTTGDATKSEKDLVRPEYPAQIAMYHVAEHGGIDDKAAGYNIFISRDANIGSVKVVRYDAERLRKEFEFGMRCVHNWQHLNNYVPRKTQ